MNNQERRLAIASNIKRAREVLRGLSQSELAQMTGLKPSAISHFETGRRTPSALNLIKLKKALAVPYSTLLDPWGDRR